MRKTANEAQKITFLAGCSYNSHLVELCLSTAPRERTGVTEADTMNATTYGSKKYSVLLAPCLAQMRLGTVSWGTTKCMREVG
jgi:hypothetical protein